MARLATVRARAKVLAKSLGGDSRAVIARSIALAKQGEEQLAFELFRAAPWAIGAMTPAQVDGLLPVLHDWNSTDCFGCFVSGVAWREGVLDDRHILGWTRSRNLWVRRAALVSTVPLNLPARGATEPGGERKRTLAVCVRLVDDREDMVVKGLSWALRVLARCDAGVVRAFVDTHEKRLASRVLREVRNKLNTGLKNPKSSPRARAPGVLARTS